MATGGMNGLFEEMTTGSMLNTSDAAAIALERGVELANLEFIQYHPTTIAIQGKRMLISEAARGEGGRLYVKRRGYKWYFMEEKYPELKNLMPRDVVSAEMVKVTSRAECDDQVFLDMTEIPEMIWNTRLSDLREQCINYLNIDPVSQPVPVSPGIHYFMGGVRVDEEHRTSLANCYAAGECACQYHGANRLGQLPVGRDLRRQNRCAVCSEICRPRCALPQKRTGGRSRAECFPEPVQTYHGNPRLIFADYPP